MKVDCNWNGKQRFVAEVNALKVLMDAARPFGDESAPTPKQLVLAALCGCTGMDVIGLLKKYKQIPEKFEIMAEANVATSHPHEFTDVKLRYLVEGPCDPNKVLEAINLSQTKYCAVSAMISRAAAITYNISLNGKQLAEGKSDFQNLGPTLLK